MKKKTQLLKYLISDYVSGLLSWCAFIVGRYYQIAQYQGFNSLKGFLTHDKAIFQLLLIPVFWIILHYYSGYYNKPLEKSRLSEFFITFGTVLSGTLIIFFGVILNELPKSFYIYYEQFTTLFLLTFFLTYTGRSIITNQATKKFKRQEWTIKALILGTGSKAQELGNILNKPSESLGYTIEAFVDTEHLDHEELLQLIREKNIDELIVADTDNTQRLLDLLYSLYHYKLPIKLPASKTRILTGGVKTNSVVGMPLIDITDNNFSESEKNIKNSLDKLISLLILIFLSPVYAYLAIRVKLDSPGPVFLQQERIGFLGKPFFIYKFRTMQNDAEKEGPLLSSGENDPRVTKYGRRMRKYRLDELPQFWNVLKGDMSIVGPRPERKHYIDQIVKQAPYYYLLHNVRPGITSLGMVKYGYASTVDQMIERMNYDILYYENMSLSFDLKILIYTIRTIMTGKGI